MKTKNKQNNQKCVHSGCLKNKIKCDSKLHNDFKEIVVVFFTLMLFDLLTVMSYQQHLKAFRHSDMVKMTC